MLTGSVCITMLAVEDSSQYSALNSSALIGIMLYMGCTGIKSYIEFCRDCFLGPSSASGS